MGVDLHIFTQLFNSSFPSILALTSGPQDDLALVFNKRPNTYIIQFANNWATVKNKRSFLRGINKNFFGRKGSTKQRLPEYLPSLEVS